MRGEALLYLHYDGWALPLRAAPEPQPPDPAGAGTGGPRRGAARAFATASKRRSAPPAPSRRHVVMWPSGPGAVPDEGEVFRLAYLPPDWSPTATPLDRWILDGCRSPGQPQRARAGRARHLSGSTAARAAARRALAVESLLSRAQSSSSPPSSERNFASGSRQRRRRCVGAHAVIVRVQVPTGLADDGSVRFASRDLATILSAGRGLHERAREALETHVASKLYPAKVAALAQLGDERGWRWVRELADAFRGSSTHPRCGRRRRSPRHRRGRPAGHIRLRRRRHRGRPGRCRSARRPRCGYASPCRWTRIALEGQAALLRVALAEELGRERERASEPTSRIPSRTGTDSGTARPAPGQGCPRAGGGDASGLRLAITATEDDLFELNRSLSKLRELVEGGTLRVNLTVEARTAGRAPIDRVRARNTSDRAAQEDPDVDVRVEWLGGGEPASG